MLIKNYREDIEIPEGISVERQGKQLIVKGPKGEVKKEIYSPSVEIGVEDNKVFLSVDAMRKREKAIVGTFRAHINNLFQGVTQGHTYKLKACSGHFPMNVSFSNNVLTVKNFIGEKVPRTFKVPDDVTVKVDGENIVVESVNKESAGQVAGSIEKLTKRVNFDKRIFQDGIYITEKDGKAIE
ncbi:MAG: 50S ribosomal protein L6 [Nanobdellota archaeon]